MVRFVSAFKAQKEWGVLRGIFTYSFKLVILLSIVVVVILMLVLLYVMNMGEIAEQALRNRRQDRISFKEST